MGFQWIGNFKCRNLILIFLQEGKQIFSTKCQERNPNFLSTTSDAILVRFQVSFFTTIFISNASCRNAQINCSSGISNQWRTSPSASFGTNKATSKSHLISLQIKFPNLNNFLDFIKNLRYLRSILTRFSNFSLLRELITFT